MSLHEARARLQRQQDAMVVGLAGGTPPAGLDAEVIARARALLAHKRRWVEARRARARPHTPGWLARAARLLLGA